MSELAQYLNELSDEALASALRACCGSSVWVKAMTAARPFADDEDLHRKAQDKWFALSHDDWREAFARHPRIGAKPTIEGVEERWSVSEQAGVREATDEVKTRLHAHNQTYEERFGHVFLICATGLDAPSLLGALETRLTNDPDEELMIAAIEQSKITKIRLRKLLEP